MVEKNGFFPWPEALATTPSKKTVFPLAGGPPRGPRLDPLLRHSITSHSITRPVFFISRDKIMLYFDSLISLISCHCYEKGQFYQKLFF